jgi:hypothetical protein
MNGTATAQVYDYKDIMAQLRIGKNQAYILLKSGAFPIIQIGKTYKVSRIVFDSWLNHPQAQ